MKNLKAAGVCTVKGCNSMMQKKEKILQRDAVPHSAANKLRNIELAHAIAGYFELYDPDNDKERNKYMLEIIRGWALEIVLNCDAELEADKLERID